MFPVVTGKYDLPCRFKLKFKRLNVKGQGHKATVTEEGIHGYGIPYLVY